MEVGNFYQWELFSALNYLLQMHHNTDPKCLEWLHRLVPDLRWEYFETLQFETYQTNLVLVRDSNVTPWDGDQQEIAVLYDLYHILSYQYLVGGWTTHLKKNSQNGFIFPKDRDENKKIFQTTT